MVFLHQRGVHTGQDGQGDVGADIGDAFHIAEQIHVDRPGVDVALVFPHPGQMVFLHRLDEIVHDLLQRLDVPGGLFVALSDSQLRIIQNMIDQLFEDVQLFQRVLGKAQILLVERAGVFRDVHGVVADPLKAVHQLIILIQDCDVLFRGQVHGQ